MHIPQELQSYPSFVVWKYAEIEGKIKKPPFSPKSGQLASPTNPETWGTLQQAQEALKTGLYEGVGFVFSEEDPFAGVDVDDCIDADGNLEANALPLLVTLDSYAEVSPSGRGLHILVEGKLPQGGRRKGHVELYDTGRYFTITGNHLPHSPETIQPRQQALELILHTLNGQDTTQQKDMRQNVSYEVTAYRTKDDILRLAREEVRDDVFIRLFDGNTAGFTSKSNADFTFILKLLYYCNDDIGLVRSLFLESKLVDGKTLSRRGDTDYLGYTIENAIKKRRK